MDTDKCATTSCLRECKVARNSGSSNPVATAANNSLPSPNMGNVVDEHLRKIFIGGLSTQTTVDTLLEFFRQFGAVADAVVMRDPVSNHSRGFGFVTYVDPTSVEKVQKARPHTIDNKAVETKPALPRHEFNKPGGGSGSGSGGPGGAKTTKIFLGGLKECHDEKSIREYFSQFGAIVGVKLLIDKDTGRKRGFGFLEFGEPSSAERALAQGKHSINLNTVEVKKSTQKPDSGKRLRFPVSGSVRAGYIPPQPATMDSYGRNGNYNPYLVQSVLPPSAFINGWAAYVTPVVPPTPPGHYAAHQKQHPGQPFPGYGPNVWSSYPKPGKYAAQEWTPSKLGEWPPKAGHKHAQTSTTDRPKNDSKSVQVTPSAANVDLGARGDADGGSAVKLGPGLKAGASVGIGAIKKWPTEDFKIFKPAQAPAHGLNPKVGNGGSPPTYGV
ncbi:RNA-binding protein Musashi homolog 2 [Drosophila biarmipes]|uniref:RNA-binding protein Musashi homolog 2 n=1 Tax=Drosophila biarmipes TaxID=125945 RepID=UPI001CDA6C25|nr:RNA-binding protein Musashi homolog 2 [Drosophila biarmipes]